MLGVIVQQFASLFGCDLLLVSDNGGFHLTIATTEKFASGSARETGQF
jgi:hypothetical protein